MREIKFRGKPTNNDDWVYGDYTRLQVPLSDEVVHYIVVNLFSPVEVKPETVGQYTGLKDKNGKEIFEGDIVQVNGGSIGSIVWHDNWASFCLKLALLKNENGSFSKVFGSSPLFNDAPKYLKIGNTHSNPELLEV